jgi:hypothetical protein
MLGAIALVLTIAAPATVTPAPPPPRASAGSLPPPVAAPKKRGERTWLPTTYALSREPGFTPWTSFLSLGDGRIGRWTAEGTSFSGGTNCSNVRYAWCEAFAQAILALVWQPHGTPLGFYAGLNATSMPNAGAMQTTVGPSAGIRITTGSLASIVKRARRHR